MKRLFFPVLLGAVALLAPGRSLAQEKPVLNTAPVVIPAPVQPAPAPTPAPVPVDTTRRRAARPTYTPPAGYDDAQPQPNQNSPSGLELPGREQARRAAQEHADQYTKFFIYSGFGLSYSSNAPYYDGGAFNISVSPALGYRINDRISIGPGISYAHTSQTFGKGNPTLSLNNLGGKVFAQVRVIDQFFVHGEYEVTNAQLPLVDANGYYMVNKNNEIMTGNRTVSSPLLGAGYRSQLGTRVAADIVALYNFNDSFNNSIYSNPVIRFNFLFNIGH